jgi:hypothetical protein
MLTTKVWKPIEGFEGSYDVSDHGDVRSNERLVPGKHKGHYQVVRTRILKSRPQSKSEHQLVWLRKDGKTVAKNVHRLVAEAFLGPCPDGMECCHIDGDPTNNHLSNLRWDTRKSNRIDAIRHGSRPVTAHLRKTGHDHPHSLLTPVQVQLIRESVETCVVLAQIHGVSPMTISRCRSGKTYTYST